MPRLAWLLPAVLWAVAIAFLSLRPKGVGGGPAGLDKVLHAGAYAGLAWLISWGMGVRRWAALAACALLAAAFGAGIEVAQATWVPGRSGEVADGVANLAGALVAVVLFGLFSSKDRIE